MTEGQPSEADLGFFQRIIPRSMLGLASLLFFMSIASAFSGAALFAYYRFELDDTQARVARVESRTADDVEAAKQILEAETDSAIAQIESLLEELEQFAATGKTVSELLGEVRESVFLVRTLDEAGQPSVGTAFVVFSDSERSFLLTSYTTVRAATVSPGPGIEVSQGGAALGITLNGWDEERDLALLIAEDAPNLPTIELGDPSSVDAGDRIFAVSALGTAGGAIVQGFVADVSATGIQHDAPIGVQFQGGPMLNAKGQLVGISSRRYAPLRFVPEAVFFGIPLREACAKVIDCPSSLTG